MSIIRRMRKQTAVWWARGEVDTFGKWTFAVPVEIACRWDDDAVEYRDAQGELQVSQAVIYPDRVLGVGDLVKLTDLDSNTPDDPSGLQGVYAVARMATTPNLKATEFLYTAYLT